MVSRASKVFVCVCLAAACIAISTSRAHAQTPATICNIDPDTLNLGSKGNPVTAYIATGSSYTWQHGFLPESDYYNHPDVTQNVGYDTWFSFTSPDLMLLTPGQDPVTKMWSAKPELIIGVSIGGNGWDFHGKADSAVLKGSVGGVATGNLLANGGFDNGFASWTQTSGKNPGNPSVFTWLIDTLDGTPAPCFEYDRTNSMADGGWIGVYQPVWKSVVGWDNLFAAYDVKIISNSLTDSGWWWTVFGSWGETPGRIIVHYMSDLAPANVDASTVAITGIDLGADGTIDAAVNLPTVKPSGVNGGFFVAKFVRKDLEAALKDAGVTDGSMVRLIITGSFTGGAAFTLSDTIRVTLK